LLKFGEIYPMEVIHMFKKELLVKMGTMIMAFVFVVPFNGSTLFIGESQLPKKFQKE